MRTSNFRWIIIRPKSLANIRGTPGWGGGASVRRLAWQLVSLLFSQQHHVGRVLSTGDGEGLPIR